jgi:RNA polymerase sigma-70 factor (ECF subfamily)
VTGGTIASGSGISGNRSDKSDAELVADLRANASGSDALGLLLRRYARLVHKVAAAILRDAAEAEDVTQEVFLEIYRKSHLYNPARGTVKVWLLQYAYHRTLRRKEVLRRRAAYRGEPLELVEGRVEPAPRHLSREESRWLIRAGLAQLPERQRTTLELVFLEDLPLKDVALRLRVSLGCARHYYYRGLARLKVWAQTRAAPRRHALPPTARAAKRDRRTASTADRAGGGRDRARRRPLDG